MGKSFLEQVTELLVRTGRAQQRDAGYSEETLFALLERELEEVRATRGRRLAAEQELESVRNDMIRFRTLASTAQANTSHTLVALQAAVLEASQRFQFGASIGYANPAFGDCAGSREINTGLDRMRRTPAFR